MEEKKSTQNQDSYFKKKQALRYSSKRDSEELFSYPTDTHSAMNSKGVQELKSASGIDFLFAGVSKVTL